MKTAALLLAAAGLTLGAGSAHGTTILLETDFDSLSAGGITATDLNNVTTGGLWTLNAARDGATYVAQIENAVPGPAGDGAIVLDDSNLSGTPTELFSTLSFDAAADFSAEDVVVNFRTATRRTGTNKGIRYEFFSGATSVASLDWVEGGGLTLNGTDTDTGNSAFEFLFSWINDGLPGGVRDATFTFSNGTLGLEFIDVDLDGGGTPSSASLTVAIGQTSIDSMTVSSLGDGTSGSRAIGVFLDDITVSQIPEPGSMALLGIGGLMMIKRRRRN